jgi:poly-gamma-glutamate synthesis protein (capsule biosynthesis protein)
MTNKSFENCFVAVGDIMLGDSAICVGFGFHSRYKRDLSPAFASVAPLLQRGEIVFGNLECLLARGGHEQSRLGADQMRGDPEYAGSLRSLGFTAIGVANNHAMQHGIQAFEETIESLERAGIACVGLRGRDGWSAAPVVQTTRGGLRVGLLGYSWRPRQYDYATPPYAEGDVSGVEDDVRRLETLADAVVVSLHWGEEFLSSPSIAEVDAAHRIMEAGATVIVGHHPHVVRPVERYGKGVICYSLGNFATDMLWQPELRRGAVIECRFDRRAVLESRLWSTRVDDTYAPIVDAANMQLQDDAVSGIDETAYRVAVAASVRRQQRAAYKYAIRNLHHYPPEVLAELMGTTLRNKAAALMSRVFSRHGESTIATAARPANSGPAGPLSILHVVAPAHFGGLESVLRELAAGHVRRGHTVRVALVLSPGDQPHPLVAALEEGGVIAIPLYVANRDYPGERRAIRALCRQHRPDILHTHGYRSDVIDGIVARSEGISVVSTCHGFIESNLRGRFHQWLQRRALRRFDAVVAVSRAIEHRLLEAGVAPTRVHVVPNAATAATGPISREEARRLLELPDTAVIGWVGRLSAEKGPDIALEAFARLAERGVRLVFLGTGREASRLHARAAALGVSDRVIWRDEVPNAGRLFRAFDAFLLSSRTEGTPMALLEAMAASVPIVATRVGGIPDVIDSSSGHLFESGDVNGIAAGLAEVLRNPDASRAMAERAQKRLNDGFAVEPWLSMYESIYRGIVRPM